MHLGRPPPITVVIICNWRPWHLHAQHLSPVSHFLRPQSQSVSGVVAGALIGGESF